jgi:hypothetical protein
MSCRDNSSRCQGLTPNELQPAVNEHSTSNSHSRMILRLTIFDLRRSVFRQETLDLPCVRRPIIGAESNVGEAYGAVTVYDDARRHTAKFESLRPLATRIKTNLKVRFESPQE